MKKLYTADFETTTDPNDCRVWAWGVCEIGNPSNFIYGNSIDTFFEFMENSDNSTFYFHNLKFDGEFMMVWLFEHDFKHVLDRKEETTKTFSTLISDKGQFYAEKVIFKKGSKKTKFAQIYDSLKILPFSVEEIAKGFGLPIKKLKLDYDEFREIGHKLTPQEIDYVRNDVEIMARALHVLFEQGLDRMTQAGNAFVDYKATVGERNFERWFPVPDYDEDVRQAYKGGFTYLKTVHAEKDVGMGLVFDVNSLYPWALRDCPLPYGRGVWFNGKYEYDKLYPLYVQMIRCQFKLKPNHIPTIQLKNNLSFIPTQYLESSGDEKPTLVLSSVDFELFQEHYEICNPEYLSGWKFRSATGLFAPYIDKWTKVKIESTLNGNKAMRTLAKLMLNALYGRFAINPKVASKIPYYSDGIIKYDIPKEDYIDENGKPRKRIKYEYREPIYIPVGIFVTAWARYKTITSAQKVYHQFLYADTDSLHLRVDLPKELLEMSEKKLQMLTTEDLKKYGVELPEGFTVDPVALGAWKVESRFYRARYLRQKCYVEEENPPELWGSEKFSSAKVKEYCEENNIDFDEELKKYNGMYDTNKLKITCAGMPSACYEYVTWENFRIGAKYAGKLSPNHVRGGIVLKPIDFTIKSA